MNVSQTFSPEVNSGFRIGSMLDAFFRNVRFTLRGLRQRPGFTLIVVLSLALGIGANTAIFSLVDAILLRPLPIPNAKELVVVDIAASRLLPFGNTSYLDYQDFRSRSKSFQNLAISQQMSAGMSTGNGEAQVVFGLLVSGSFFSTMQVQPFLGRDFRPEEDEAPGKYPVSIISYSLWSKAFGQDPGVIGRQVKLNGQNFTIIGVMPQSFTGADLFFRPDIYLPNMMANGFTTDGLAVFTHRGWRGYSMQGRLKPGVSLAQAQAELDTIMRDLERAYPDTNKDTIAYVRKEMNRRMQNGFLLPAILMTLVVLVLLIACANVASLLMARATSRMKEISTQLAIGATRSTVIFQLLTESAVLAFLGGVCGILLGYGCIRGFMTVVPFSVTPTSPDFHLDSRVLMVAIVASTLAVFLCGLAPAFLAVKEAMTSVTTNVRAGVSGSRVYGMFARRLLIGGQIALSTILLIVGGLFLKALTKAQKVDLGFNPEQVLLVGLDPSLRGYSTEKAMQFNHQLAQAVAGLPGVKSAGLGVNVPFISGASWDISIDGYVAPGGEKFVDTPTNQVGPGYFATMQIPVLRGREFTEQDAPDKPLVVIVNETLARRYIVGQGDLDKAVGHNIRLRDHDKITVVGVVKDSSYGGIGTPVPPVFYTSYAQMPRPTTALHIRTEGDPTALVSQVRGQIKILDPDIAPTYVTSMTKLVSSSGLFMPRITAILGSAFGAVAMLLSVIGLYGVVSFLVGRRTQEIGVRVALGAQRSAILRMILSNGISLAGFGLLAGAIGAYLLTPLMNDLLVGVSPRDPVVFLGIAFALIVATLAASWIPARRATHIDPIEALRYE
jgi:macrolide transport system ATP-binding/permease protein